MKRLITLVLFLPMLCTQALDLNTRLWRELEKSKHEMKVSSSTKEDVTAQDLSWLEDANQINDESVDEVMAEFNRPPETKGQEDSISLRMSGLKKPDAPVEKKENSRSPAIIQDQGDDYSMTRGRSR